MVQKFNKFFIGTQHYIYVSNGSPHINFVNEPANEIISKLNDECVKNSSHINQRNESSLLFSTSYGTLAKGGLKTFGCNYGFEIRFEHNKFWVEVDKFVAESSKGRETIFPERLLHKPLAQSEIDLLVKTLGESIFTHIDFHTKKNGIR